MAQNETTASSATSVLNQALRLEIESFLFLDAQLLDEWRLDDWGKTIAPGARYMVPSLDEPNAGYQDSLYLISDDYLTLMSRISQLQGRNAWVENPKSRTRRMISNVQANETDNNQIEVKANFAIWRFHQESTMTYVGRYEHLLVREDDRLLFKVRKSILDMETLRPHGRISIIL